MPQITFEELKTKYQNKLQKDTEVACKIISKLKQKGAEAVILACTDLPLLVSQEKSTLPLINTLEILANSAVDLLSNKGR